MLGIKESLNKLLDHLSTIPQKKSFAFQILQIKHTTRYLLFWSFFHTIPVEKNHKLKITVQGKRFQILKVPTTFDFKVFCDNLQTKYADPQTEQSTHATDNFILKLIHNKWSRKSRRSDQPPILLHTPVEIFVTFQINDQSAELVMVPDAQADWEIFLGFVNHLRKDLEHGGNSVSKE